jgi:hypothetical protein
MQAQTQSEGRVLRETHRGFVAITIASASRWKLYSLPFTFVGDGALPFLEKLLKTCPQNGLST